MYNIPPYIMLHTPLFCCVMQYYQNACVLCIIMIIMCSLGMPFSTFTSTIHTRLVLKKFTIFFSLHTCYYRFNQNYGVMGVLDRLHGTDEAFRRSKSHDRHVVLLGLSSARELYPDPPKGKGSPCHQAKATTGDGSLGEVSSCCM